MIATRMVPAALLIRDQESVPETRKLVALIPRKAVDKDSGVEKPRFQSFSERSPAPSQVKTG